MPLREYATFFRQFRERFETTGAIAPSSRYLARAMVGPLSQRGHAEPVRILEIGPGTGAVTRTLITHMRDGDHLDLVELNTAFAELLEHRFNQEQDWQRVRSQAHVHVVPIQEFQPEAPYDFVISGLPFNNFPEPLVKDILASVCRLVKPDGILSYFEYQFVRSVRRRIGTQAERQRLTGIDDVLRSYTERMRIRRNWVFLNLPPAWVQHLRVQQDIPGQESR